MKKSQFKCLLHPLPPSRKKRASSLIFQIQLPTLKMSETLMPHFQKMRLGQREKSALTQRHRREIQLFRKLDKNQVQQEARKLIKKLKRPSQERVKVSASGIAAWVCLAAISSGELRPNPNWQFEFSPLPLKFFSPSLVKKKSFKGSWDIRFLFDDSDDLAPLYSPPQHLKFFYK